MYFFKDTYLVLKFWFKYLQQFPYEYVHVHHISTIVTLFNILIAHALLLLLNQVRLHLHNSFTTSQLYLYYN